MRAGLRTEGEDERHQSATGRDRVGQQCETGIPAGKALGHDPGADNRDQQETRRDKLDKGCANDGPAQRRRPGHNGYCHSAQQALASGFVEACS